MKKLAWLAALLLPFVLTACSGGSYRIGAGHVDSTSHSIHAHIIKLAVEGFSARGELAV